MIEMKKVDDICQGNPVLHFGIRPSLPVSAVIWTARVTDSLLSARRSCLDHALKTIAAFKPRHDFWLVAAHATLQVDNRITRYYGLWKSIRNGGAVTPQGWFTDEFAHHSGSEMRVFGAVRYGPNQLDAIHSVMLAAQAVVVAVPGDASRQIVDKVVREGWPLTRSVVPVEIVDTVCSRSGLVIGVCGSFDDSDVCTYAVCAAHELGNLGHDEKRMLD